MDLHSAPILYQQRWAAAGGDGGRRRRLRGRWDGGAWNERLFGGWPKRWFLQAQYGRGRAWFRPNDGPRWLQLRTEARKIIFSKKNPRKIKRFTIFRNNFSHQRTQGMMFLFHFSNSICRCPQKKTQNADNLSPTKRCARISASEPWGKCTSFFFPLSEAEQNCQSKNVLSVIRRERKSLHSELQNIFDMSTWRSLTSKKKRGTADG